MKMTISFIEGYPTTTSNLFLTYKAFYIKQAQKQLSRNQQFVQTNVLYSEFPMETIFHSWSLINLQFFQLKITSSQIFFPKKNKNKIKKHKLLFFELLLLLSHVISSVFCLAVALHLEEH